MHTVFKYEVPLGAGSVRMPEDARIISTAAVGDRVFVWAIVDPNTPLTERHMKIVGTGHPFDPGGWRFVGTAVMHDGVLIWHVFEREEGPTLTQRQRGEVG